VETHFSRRNCKTEHVKMGTCILLAETPFANFQMVDEMDEVMEKDDKETNTLRNCQNNFISSAEMK